MTLHVEKKIQAYLDSELSSHDAETVRSHCAGCERCGRLLEELSQVQTLLRIDKPAKPLRPMWPAVMERLSREATPRPGWRFTVGSAAAALAGVILGFFLGTTRPIAPRAEVEDVWADLGSTVVAESGTDLSELYFGLFIEGEQTP
jgi:anti-sigma factor RsiW